MSHTIVPGDVVRYTSVACYTGMLYTFHALTLSIKSQVISVIVLNDSGNDLRDLDPDRCLVVGHVTPPSHHSKGQITFADLPQEIQDGLAPWMAT